MKVRFRSLTMLFRLAIVTAAMAGATQVSADEIHDAVAQNDLARVKALLSKRPRQINAVAWRGAYTPLTTAITNGRLEIARFLLSKNANVDRQTTFGASALHLAVAGNHPAIVDLILAKKPKLDLIDDNGWTPLFHAIRHCRASIVKKLIDAGAGINLKARFSGSTPLHLACQYDNENIFKMLLKANADIHAQDGVRNTPLFAAAQLGHMRLVRALVSKGADVRSANRIKQTPLHYACMSARFAVVDFLLKLGVEADVKDHLGVTPLYLACRFQPPETVRSLLECGATADLTVKSKYHLFKPTPLHVAALRGNADILTLLLAKNAEVSVANSVGNRPLHLVAEYGLNKYVNANVDGHLTSEDRRKKCAKMTAALLDAGADPNAKNKKGQTPLRLAFLRNNHVSVECLLPVTKNVSTRLATGEPLFHWAARNGHGKAVGILLKRRDPDFNKKDNRGRTPLEIACDGTSQGHAEVVKRLVAVGVPLDGKNAGGETVLHIAAWNGNADLVRALLNGKADVAAKDVAGHMPIHHAAWNGHVKTVEALIAAGASPSANTSRGYTPLHAAAWKGRTAVVKTLLKHKADTSAKDSDGLTPLHRAAWNGHLAIVKALHAAGADLSEEDNNGHTALVKAAEQKQSAVVKYLKRVIK